MILKFRSNELLSNEERESDGFRETIIPAQDWTWLDDVEKLQIVELIDIPIRDGLKSEDTSGVAQSYLNPMEYFADCHWVGIIPRLYNQHVPEWKRDNGRVMMCYVYKRNGKVDLLAVGFCAEIYLCNDEGKTIDSIQNPTY
jgi:hypothetical protein